LGSGRVEPSRRPRPGLKGAYTWKPEVRPRWRGTAEGRLHPGTATQRPRERSARCQRDRLLLSRQRLRKRGRPETRTAWTRGGFRANICSARMRCPHAPHRKKTRLQRPSSNPAGCSARQGAWTGTVLLGRARRARAQTVALGALLSRSAATRGSRLLPAAPKRADSPSEPARRMAAARALRCGRTNCGR